MSADFETRLSYDSRLNDVSDKIQYLVEKGSADNTFQQFNANTESATAINFTINPPSESTVISRNLYIQSTVQFTIRIGGPGVPANVPIGVNVFQPGLRDGLASFPLNRLFNTVTISVNNVSISFNQNLILPGLLRMLDPEQLQEYNGMCPAYLDNYANYPDCPGTNNNPFGDYGTAGYQSKLLPRGCHPLEAVVIRHFPAVGPPDASAVSTALNDYWEIDVDFKSTEPFFVSPMLFGDPKFNQSGFLGINNFQIVISTDATASRAWGTGLVTQRDVDGRPLTPYSMALRGKGFTSSRILMNFLTAPISMVLPPKSALPFSSYIAYTTTNQANIAAGASAELNINSVQFEVIPDKLILFVRRKLSDQDAYESDSFLSITSLQATFGNKSGLLSNMTQQDMYKLSKKNGLHQDWYCFSGLAGKYSGVAPNFSKYATVGSVVVMDPSMDFGLQSPYLSNGSIGQFNLQLRLNVTNQTDRSISPEIVLVAMRSGVVVTSSGQSTLTTNMLNASIVTKAIEDDKNPMGSDYHKRLVGGMKSASDGPATRYCSGKHGAGGSKSGGKYSKLDSLAM
jgi:hypothetical protein